MSPSETPDLQTILSDIFAFSPADIAVNRTGKLSPAQRERITRKHYANSRLAWRTFALIFGLGLIGFSAEMIRTGNTEFTPWLYYFRITFFFGLLVWGFILYYRHQMKRTLQEGKVQSVTGKIRIVGERGEKMMHWYFYVGDHRFDIDRPAHRILLQQSGIEGREATAYFSAPWRDLLSVVLQA